MGIRFITPETITLPLSDGDSITIKKQLSHGERDAMFKLARDRENLRTAEVVAYLVTWSARIPYALDMTEQERVDIINGLDADSFDEIQAALVAHIDGERKKKQTTGNGSSAISTSPAAVIGATSGSESLTPTSTTSS